MKTPERHLVEFRVPLQGERFVTNDGSKTRWLANDVWHGRCWVVVDPPWPPPPPPPNHARLIRRRKSKNR